MFKILNIIEIFKDYFNNLTRDLNIIPLIIIILGIPLFLTLVFSYFMNNSQLINQFNNNLITFNAILIPLMINILMIVYYSIERLDNNKESQSKIFKNKLEFLNHINSTVSVTIIGSLILLILSLIGNSNFSVKIPIFNDYNFTNIHLQYLIYFLLSFLIINIIITLKRIYLLIKFDIKEISNDIS